MSEAQEPGEPSASSEEFRSGPFPDPAILAEYDRILPGSAERLLRLVEMEQLHRHQVETKIVSQNARAARVGQILGFVAIGISIVAGVFLSFRGLQVSGAIIGGLGTLSPLVAYVLSKFDRANDPGDDQGSDEVSRVAK